MKYSGFDDIAVELEHDYSPDELMNFWGKHQRGRGYKTLFPKGGKGAKKATAALASFAANLATAKSIRLGKIPGGIDTAKMYENIADSIYRKNPVKRRKPRTPAQIAATRRMLAGLKAKRNPRRMKKHDPTYWVFTVHDGYISHRSDSGYTGSTPFTAIAGNTVKQKIATTIKQFALKRGQYEILDDRTQRNPARRKKPGITAAQIRAAHAPKVRMLAKQRYHKKPSDALKRDANNRKQYKVFQDMHYIASFHSLQFATEYAKALHSRAPKTVVSVEN